MASKSLTRGQTRDQSLVLRARCLSYWTCRKVPELQRDFYYETFITYLKVERASLEAQLVKNPPAMQKIPVRFLGQEDPLEKGWATHSSILGFPWWLSW